jgi:hypothetical protein
MRREVWRKLWKGFVARLVVPLAVVFVVLVVMELWSMRARAQAERSKPKKPPVERRQDPAAPPRLGRDFTKSEPPANRDWVPR